MRDDILVAAERLQARISGFVLASAGGCFPFQATGGLYGLPFYFRYRHGQASLQLGDNLLAPLYRAVVDYGNDNGGTLTAEEFATLMLRLVPELRVAPRLWEFAGVMTHDTPVGAKVGDPYLYGAWGYTPEEAWEQMFAYPTDPFLTQHFTPESWTAHIEARRMNPQTVTVDTRVWPEPKPIFEVRPLPQT